MNVFIFTTIVNVLTELKSMLLLFLPWNFLFWLEKYNLASVEKMEAKICLFMDVLDITYYLRNDPIIIYVKWTWFIYYIFYNYL